MRVIELNWDARQNLPPPPSCRAKPISKAHELLFAAEAAAFAKIEYFFGVGPSSPLFNSAENIAKFNARQTEEYENNMLAWQKASDAIGRAFPGFHPASGVSQ